MTAMSVKEDNTALVSQCLDFCQTLAAKSLTFSFTLSLGNSFSLSLDSNGKEALASKGKKKKTPSALKRDARRREKFLKKKLEVSTVDISLQSKDISEEENVGKQVAEKALDEKAFKCEQCDTIFKSENGLKIHIGKSHKKVDSTPATPERLRQQTNSSVSLSASPLLDTSREESSALSPVADDIKSTSKKPAPRYQPPPIKCDHCDLYLPWFVMNWKGAQLQPHHICTCNP